MPEKPAIDFAVWGIQVAPPSVVERIAAGSVPITQPVVGFAKWTAVKLRFWATPVTGVQGVAPPSVVLRIVPPCPTAQPVLASTKLTPRRKLVSSFIWGFQVAPPSDVETMAAWSPTAHPALGVP